MSSNTSLYDPSRDTVGAIYRQAQLNNRVEKIECGDMSRELTKSLVEDLNEAIVEGSKEFDGREFYITVHEKKDAQMKSAFLRRLIKTLYRPWPEDDTVVFRILPGGDVRFCWCLDHHTEISNKLHAHEIFDPEEIDQLRAWANYDFHSFGFVKTDMGEWIPNLNWEDQKLGVPKNSIRLYMP